MKKEADVRTVWKMPQRLGKGCRQDILLVASAVCHRNPQYMLFYLSLSVLI